MSTKAEVLRALRDFVAQRPGIESGNYSDANALRQEYRQVRTDRWDAERLINAVRADDGITVDDILRYAQSGRLTIEVDKPHKIVDSQKITEELRPYVSYCTGQYFPVEYRKAVARLMSECLWHRMRELLKTADGDTLRRSFKKLYGSRMAARYFD